jgi:hypothetical protein
MEDLEPKLFTMLKGDEARNRGLVLKSSKIVT